jgi:hypothetical protein
MLAAGCGMRESHSSRILYLASRIYPSTSSSTTTGQWSEPITSGLI